MTILKCDFEEFLKIRGKVEKEREKFFVGGEKKSIFFYAKMKVCVKKAPDVFWYAHYHDFNFSRVISFYTIRHNMTLKLFL